MKSMILGNLLARVGCCLVRASFVVATVERGVVLLRLENATGIQSSVKR